MSKQPLLSGDPKKPYLTGHTPTTQQPSRTGDYGSFPYAKRSNPHFEKEDMGQQGPYQGVLSPRDCK